MAELYLTQGGASQPYDFSGHPSLTLQQLAQVDEPCVIFEGTKRDSDGVLAYLYTVGGFLDGQALWPGHTVGGDIILVHANSREQADELAGSGLEDTISNLLQVGVDQDENAGILTSAGVRRRPH